MSASGNVGKDAAATYVPRSNSSLLVAHNLSSLWTGSLAYYWVDKMRWAGSGDPVDSYSRVDLRLGRKLRFGNQRGEAAVVVQNANHNNYANFSQQNIADRRMFLTLSLGFL